MNEQEWLEERRKFVTARDIPALLGFDPYNSPLKLWVQKVEGEEQDSTQAMEIGLDLQPVLIRKAGKITGWATRELSLDEAWKTKGILGATLDGKITVPADKEQRAYGLGVMGHGDDIEPGEYILECKTTGRSKDDDLTAAWYAQVQTQMYVHDIPYAFIIVLVMDYNRRYLMYINKRDDAFIESAILPAAEEFYKHLIDRTPPPAEYDIDLPIIKRLYKTEGRVVETPEYNNQMAAYIELQEKAAELRNRLRSIEVDMDQIEAQLWQVATSEKASQIIGDQYVATFYVNKRKSYSVPEQEIKRVTIKEKQNET